MLEGGRMSISESVVKKDHYEKVSGETKYTCDVKLDDVLYSVIVRSEYPSAKVIKVTKPSVPKGYYIIGAEDVPGENVVKIITNDQPIFASHQVDYIGQPMFMIVGEDRNILKKIQSSIKIEYEILPSCITLDEAIASEAKTRFKDYHFGITENAFEDIVKSADKVVEEVYETGYQEHVYLEPQAMTGIYTDEEIIIQGTMQCPYYIKNAVANAVGSDVRIRQMPTGGGFGGKEDYPSMMACQVAIAALITRKTVLLTLDRREDMAFTTKRHPSKIFYRTALDEKGDILGCRIKIYLNAGANEGLSSVVLQRALINAMGVYHLPNLSVEGAILKTNTVPTGAFRGFGAPQSVAGIESHMTHLSKCVGKDSLLYKHNYIVKQGDPTGTAGIFRDPILLKQMIEDVQKDEGYESKHIEFKSYNKKNKRYKKGLGTSLFLHGCGFTGSGERDHIKAEVRLDKTKEDIVIIRIANVDMGQGLLTTMSKIVAKVLDIDYEKIEYPLPDTKFVPDSGPTVASRTTMIVGRLLEKAAIRLKETWQVGREQSITEHYVHEESIPWDESKFTGDAYPAYSWGLNMVEITVDTLTGNVTINNAYGSFDVGTAIDDRIMQGQVEGGMVQGMAYGYLENMTADVVKGHIMQRSISDYAPPTALDVAPIKIKMYPNPYTGGPFGAKGAGELTLIGGAPAIQNAIEDALDINFHQIPVTPELIVNAINRPYKGAL